MSVLNTMLGDLERRGHASPLSLTPREEQTHESAPPSAPLILVSDRIGRPVGLALLLAAVAAGAIAFWLWPRPAPAPTNPPSPALTGAAAGAPLAPVPAAADAPPTRSELPPLAVERIAPPALASQPAADLPAAARSEQAGDPSPTPPPLAASAPVLPMHPHTPTPRAGLASDGAPEGSARSQRPAISETAGAANANADAESKPAVAANAAKAGEPAVAQSAGQSDLARAMALVARGRASDAMELLASGLAQRPAWHEARSALAALQADAGDRQQALATLLGGAMLDPNRFAPMAAQLQAELNDPAGAMQTLDRVPTEARDPAYHGLAGAIAQRAGQHERAVAEYGMALRSTPSNSLAWVGLAVSLQALGRNAQALAAYQAAAGGSLSPEMRRFVEARISGVRASAQPPAPQPR